MTDSINPHGYEVRDRRGIGGRPRLEGWVRGMHWPVVTAVETDVHKWLLFVEPAAAKLAGVEGADMVDLTTTGAVGAQRWVELIAALYAKAVERTENCVEDGGQAAVEDLRSRCAAHDQWMASHPEAMAFVETWAESNLEAFRNLNMPVKSDGDPGQLRAQMAEDDEGTAAVEWLKPSNAEAMQRYRKLVAEYLAVVEGSAAPQAGQKRDNEEGDDAEDCSW